MAVTISVGDLLLNTAQLISVPYFSENTNVTEPQAIAWLCQSLDSLQALNSQKLGPDHHHISSVRVVTQPNLAFVSLPSDAEEIFDVIWAKETDRYYRLLRTDSGHVLPLDAPPKSWEVAPTFRLEGTSLRLFPAPTERYTLSIWYGQHTTFKGDTPPVAPPGPSRMPLPLPTASAQGRLDWALWLELDLAVKCLLRKRRQADAADMTLRRDALTANLFAPGRYRHRAGPHRIQDVAWGHWPWWRGDRY